MNARLNRVQIHSAPVDYAEHAVQNILNVPERTTGVNPWDHFFSGVLQGYMSYSDRLRSMDVNTPEWDRVFKDSTQSPLGRTFKNRAIRASGFFRLVRDPDARVLDVGCGTGAFLTDLKRRGYRNLSGVEPDPDLARGIPPDITVQHCGAEHMPFADNSFDAVYVYAVLHHLKGHEAWRRSVAEMDRVLAPGGLLFILEPGSPALYRTMEAVAKLLGRFWKAMRLTAEMIDMERNELYDFLRNRQQYEDLIRRRGYEVLVNRRTFLVSPIIQWVFTARKQNRE